MILIKLKYVQGLKEFKKFAYGIGECKANVQWQERITQIWRGGNKNKVRMHDCCQVVTANVTFHIHCYYITIVFI